MIRLTGLKIPVDEDKSQIKRALIKRLRINERDLLDFKIYKQSIDARKTDMIYFVYSVDVRLSNEDAVLKKLRNDKNVSVTPRMEYEYVKPGQERLAHRPVIAGTG
ncbi:MAG: hypothetical protein K6T34_11270, partial [Thermoflavifilum sp.]|nr:hypothetical protein [Thermoflavifilum sp.]